MFKIHKRAYDKQFEVLGYTVDPTADASRKPYEDAGEPIPEWLTHSRWITLDVCKTYKQAQQSVAALVKKYS